VVKARHPIAWLSPVATLLLLTLAKPLPAAAVGGYTITDLGTQAGITLGGINDNGQIVGTRSTVAPNPAAYYGFRTISGVLIDPIADDLGPLNRYVSPTGNSYTFAYGINASGQVAGAYTASTGGLGFRHAFRTTHTGIVDAQADLGSLHGYYDYSEALGINALGQVVGDSMTPAGYDHAIRTAPNGSIGLSSDIGTLASTYGASSIAYGINDAGQAVGGSTAATGYHAFRTVANESINAASDDLGTLGDYMGNSYSVGQAINASGQVAGYSTTSSSSGYHPFRTGPDKLIDPATDDLGLLPAAKSGQTSAINDAGQVVGHDIMDNNDDAAFLYDAGGLHNLNDELSRGSGWQLLTADAINNQGQIIGIGRLGGVIHAYLLTPLGLSCTPVGCTQDVVATPELGSGELLATGLLPLGFVLVLRRRRARRATQEPTPES
jgi:probable HAF family extracellular repeat protein